MKKNLFTCFLGKLCPFHNRSRSNPPSFVSYLSDEGAVFRQPQADIFQERSDYLTPSIEAYFPAIGGLFHRQSRSISQAKGLPISNFLYQKWFLQTCLILSILSSSINEVSSQVADPPGADLLHRSMPPRGGDSRSEPYFSFTAQDIDGGPGLLSQKPPLTRPDYFGGDVNLHRSSDIGHPASFPSQKRFSLIHSDQDMKIGLENAGFQSASVSVFGVPIHSDPKSDPQKPTSQSLESYVFGLDTNISLVDTTLSPSQEEAIPSAPSGALIYGEIINPDSLGPLTIDFKSGILPQGEALHDSTIQVALEHGTFFDGVLDPRVKKFQQSIPIEEDFGLLSLKLEDRSILKDFLIFPGDSIKIGIDLQDYSFVFAGPQAHWFEAQHIIIRARKTDHFSKPRELLEIDRDALLDTRDFRLQVEQQESVFGSRIAIYEFGKDGLDHESAILRDTSLSSIPGWQDLQRFRKLLPSDRFHLLESQLIGSFYASHLATFRQYHHGMPLALGDTLSALRAKNTLPDLLEKLDKDLHTALAKGLSPGALDFAREWIATDRILQNKPLENLNTEKFTSPVQEKLIFSAFLRNLETTQLTSESWDHYAALLGSTALAEEFQVLKSTFSPDTYLAPATFHNLEGKELGWKDLKGQPSLLYFYFSGCTHSGNYFRQYLQPFYQEMGKKLGLQIIAISVDNDPELWKSQLTSYSSEEILNLNLPSIQAAEWLRKYKVMAYPRAMLLDKEGRVLSYNLDGNNFPEYAANILSLLDYQQGSSNQSIH
ncbi:thioredoxin family protein [Algoriphagus aestuarii]|nr:thioredoxin family protein [Algoriphagus aestuarii]